MNTIDWTRNKAIFRNWKRLKDRKSYRRNKKALRWLQLACDYGIRKVGVKQIHAFMRYKADTFLDLPEIPLSVKS